MKAPPRAAAASYDEGKTWPDRRLIVGPEERFYNANGSPANTNGYLAIIQTRDGRIQLVTSSKHYAFNLAVDAKTGMIVAEVVTDQLQVIHLR